MAHVHAKPDWRYWIDFFLYPAILIACIACDARSIDWIWLFAFGFVLWTFAEYWSHRSVLHTIFWRNHGTHLHHHQHPEDFVIFPIWYLPLAWVGFFVVLPVPVFAGLTAGYVWFLSLHHMLHHWPLREGSLLKSYSDWHATHHRLTFYNYGITTPVWDVVFGTFRRA